MPANLILKWGNVKGWDGMEDGHPARVALEEYLDGGAGWSAMMELQSPEQRERICRIIDAVDGEIWNDCDGVVMSKDEAKEYVRNYGQ